MRRTLPLAYLTASVFFLAASASARYVLAPGFPWSYSVTGSETLTGLDVDTRGWVWTAGNVTTMTTTGRDVILKIYSITNTGTPISVTSLDFSGVDEGPPLIVAMKRGNITEACVAFSATIAGKPSAFMLVTGQAKAVYVSSGAPTVRVAGLAVNASNTPFIAGSLVGSASEQMLHVRWPRTSLGAWANDGAGEGYPYSLPSAEKVSGRGVAADAVGNAWVIGDSAGNLVLFAYGYDTYPFLSYLGLGLRPERRWMRTYASATFDSARGVDRDQYGNLWVVGQTSFAGQAGSAAVWKFTAGGELFPGFPVAGGMLGLPAGVSSTLYAVAVDDRRRCFAVGACGSGLLLTGLDETGAPLPGSPTILSATESLASGAPDSVEGRAMAFSRDGSLWVGATVASHPASPVWRGTYEKLYLFGEVAEPPEIAPGVVLVRVRTARGTGGSVINVARGETLEILVNPTEAGDIRARILTLRGELVEEFSTVAAAGVPPAPFVWDGRNRDGQTVSSGAYALLVSGGGFRTVRRLVVIRKK